MCHHSLHHSSSNHGCLISWIQCWKGACVSAFSATGSSCPQSILGDALAMIRWSRVKNVLLPCLASLAWRRTMDPLRLSTVPLNPVSSLEITVCPCGNGNTPNCVDSILQNNFSSQYCWQIHSEKSSTVTQENLLRVEVIAFMTLLTNRVWQSLLLLPRKHISVHCRSRILICGTGLPELSASDPIDDGHRDSGFRPPIVRKLDHVKRSTLKLPVARAQCAELSFLEIVVIVNPPRLHDTLYTSLVLHGASPKSCAHINFVFGQLSPNFGKSVKRLATHKALDGLCCRPNVVGLRNHDHRFRWEDQTSVTSVPVFFGDEPCHHIWQAPASTERSVYASP